MNKSQVFSIKTVIFSTIAFVLLGNAMVQAMEPQLQEKPTIQLYNVANKDITIGAYQQDKQGAFARPELDTIYAKPGQTKEEIKPFAIDLTKRWFVTITDQAEKSLPKNELPNPSNINVLDINKIVSQQLEQKPWLANRPLAVFVKDSMRSAIGHVAEQTIRVTGYQWSPDLAVTVADQNPEENPAIEKNMLTYRIQNKNAQTPLFATYYIYNKDAGLYQFKKTVTIRTEKSIPYNLGDKIFVTHADRTKYPFFETPKTTETVIDLQAKVAEKLKDRPDLDGADLLIEVEIPSNHIAISKESFDDFYPVGQKNNALYGDLYDITNMRLNSSIVANKTISRILLYNATKQALNRSTLNRSMRNVIILVPNEAQSSEFWKLDTATMKAVLAFIRQQNVPTEIVSFTWTTKDTPENAATNLAAIINENYKNSDMYKSIMVIAHEKGGMITNIATGGLARAIDSIYQIFTQQHEKTLREAKSEKFNTLFNFYIEVGNEVLPAMNKGRIINLATTYINEKLNPLNIVPVLMHLTAIKSTITEHYKLNNNLAVTIDAAETNNGSFVTIKKEAFFSDPAKERINQEEKQFSFDQQKSFNSKYPANIGQMALELAKRGGQYIYEQVPSTETMKEYTQAAQAGIASYLSKWFTPAPKQIEQPKPQTDVQLEQQVVPGKQKAASEVLEESRQESNQSKSTIAQLQAEKEPVQSTEKQKAPKKKERNAHTAKKQEVTKEEESELAQLLEKPLTETEAEEQLKQIEQQIIEQETETKPTKETEFERLATANLETESNERILTRNIAKAQRNIAELSAENKELIKEITKIKTEMANLDEQAQKREQRKINRKEETIKKNLGFIRTWEQQITTTEKQLQILKQQK